MSDGTENTPCPDVTAENVSFVPLLVMVTSAPGTTPPPVSTTTPAMEAVEAPWAKTSVERSPLRRRTATATNRCFIARHATQVGRSRQEKIKTLPVDVCRRTPWIQEDVRSRF